MDARWEQLRRELATPMPHPDLAALRAMTDQTAAWILEHFASLPEQPLGRTAPSAEMESLLREPPPESESDFSHVLDEFRHKIAPYAIRINHPRFLAFIPSAPNFVSVLADFLCSATNFFAGVWLEAAGPSQVELVVLGWFKQFLGYPPQASGILTSGGSEANLTALLVAREPLSYEDRGRAMLYLTQERHWSMDRAAKIIGLRPDQLRPIPADAHFRLDPVALRQTVQEDRRAGRLPWAVVANAGATNTGAIDPLTDLADLCQTERLWLHVDAAYGWPAVLVPEEKRHFAGIERSDSLTLDPHKWFAQPFEAGCVLIREGKRLAETFLLRPDYMQDVEPSSEEVNFADRGVALTRRFRALKIWLSVKVLGVGWFRDGIARSCRLAELAQGLLERSAYFEILSARQLSVVCFRYVPAGFRDEGREDPEALDRLNLDLIDGVRASGRAFLSSTRLRGRVAIRLCFVNWRTTAADVEEVVRLVESVGESLAHTSGRQNSQGGRSG
ncbi:MAG TPA: aminotransferase class V-fold PLP-dependent enzyme [Gemmataceae bacterium]|nr:aminotransferase class V-fold PLP-dependent enzyme [Gemmataceae bacterium]